MKIKLTKELMYNRPLLDKAMKVAKSKYNADLGYIGTDKAGVHHFQVRGSTEKYTLTAQELAQ